MRRRGKLSTQQQSQRREAAIYVRISLDRGYGSFNDGQTFGEMALDRQEEECRERAKRDGYEITRVYRDLSRSASDERKNKKREGYNQLLADARAGEVRRVYVWDFDRLTRQPDQLNEWINLADDKKCYIVEASGLCYDLSDSQTRFNARVRLAVAENEVRHKGDRQRAAARQRAHRGMVQPQARRPIGYTRRGEVIPEEAEVVRAVYRAFLDGASIRGITAALSGDPYGKASSVPAWPCPGVTAAREYNERHPESTKPLPPDRWHAVSVTHILRNARYAGFAIYGDIRPKTRLAREEAGLDGWDQRVRDPHTGEWVRGKWEPIVSVTDWERTQEILNDPRRKSSETNRRSHIGTGLYHCSVCGERVTHVGHVYACPTRGHAQRTAEVVDAYVEDVVATVLAQDDVLQRVRVKRSGDAGEAERLNMRRVEQDRRAKQARLDYANGHIDAQTLAITLDLCAERSADIDTRLAEIERVGEAPALVNDPSPAEAFRAADVDTKRAVIDFMCEVVVTKAARGETPPGKKLDPSKAVEFHWKTDAVPPGE